MRCIQHSLGRALVLGLGDDARVMIQVARLGPFLGCSTRKRRRHSSSRAPRHTSTPSDVGPPLASHASMSHKQLLQCLEPNHPVLLSSRPSLLPHTVMQRSCVAHAHSDANERFDAGVGVDQQVVVPLHTRCVNEEHESAPTELEIA